MSEIYLVKTLQNVRLSNFLTTSRNVRIAADQANYKRSFQKSIMMTLQVNVVFTVDQ